MEGGMGDERERGRGELTVPVGRIRTRSLLMRFISWRIFEGEEEGVRKERGGGKAMGIGGMRRSRSSILYTVHMMPKLLYASIKQATNLDRRKTPRLQVNVQMAFLYYIYTHTDLRPFQASASQCQVPNGCLCTAYTSLAGSSLCS